MSMRTSRTSRPLGAALALGFLLSGCGHDKPADSTVVLGKRDSPPVLAPVVVRPPDFADGPAADGSRAAQASGGDQSRTDEVPAAPAPRAVATAVPSHEAALPPPRPAVDRRTAAIDVPPPPPRAPVPARAAPPPRVPVPVRAAPAPRPPVAVATPVPPRAAEPRTPPADVAVAPGRDGDARSLNREGIALINAGRPEQAIEVLERAAALAPRDAELLGNLGYAYMLAGENSKASARFQRSLDIAPTRSATWLNLGQTYAELGQRERAVDAVLTGYRNSTRKATVRAALQAAATGHKYSAAWREAAGLALSRIGDG